jgi:hypothetical protein
MNGLNYEIKPAHYYGDVVRILFLAAALVMLITLPAIKDYLNIPAMFSVLVIMILSFVAGLTNPKQIWEAAVNAAISVIGFLVFESYALWAYQHYSATDKFFITNLILGFVFLFAIYFSTKTLRGLWLDKRQ